MYTPLRQWFHLDLFDLIPKNINGTKTLDNKNRYNDYIALFGDEFIQKIKQSKGLVTGAGASACELVKMFSMMGMATGVNGRIYVADDRKIQIHHLASHFMLKK
jgi:ubiquitin-activating enzyme E1